MIPRHKRGGNEAPGAWVLWASDLSPFALKVDAACDYVGLAHRWLPAEGGRREGLRARRRVEKLRSGKLPLTFPEPSELDELPLVPFLLGPEGENLYDSSAIGAWLDGSGLGNRLGAGPLLPGDDPALRFALRLVDESFDEFGLYLVHHNRWVVSARDNGAGARLAADFRPILGGLATPVGRWFAARQVRRLPYLFSVAPKGRAFDDLPPRLRPPAPAGFPPTHALLEERFARLLGALEALLGERPYLFGERFTLADASAYGQLAMNLSDASAAAWIRRDAPKLHAWLTRIAAADFSTSRAGGELRLDASLAPLLAEICATFVPLMQQNCDAWRQQRDAGETRFNEAAFDAGRALYDGTLAGHAFRSVVKTFQVRVWRSLRSEWDALGDRDRARLEALLPPDHGLARDGSGAEARPGGGPLRHPMQIAIFIYGPSGGGATRRTLTLAGGFAERGHRVDLVVVNADGPLAEALPAGVRLVVLDSLPVRLAGRLRRKRRKREIAASGFALARYLWRERPDVLMSAANHVHLTALFAARFSRAPARIVLRVSTHLTQSHLGGTGRPRPNWLKLARRAYGWADAAIAVSHGIAEDLVEHTALPRNRVSAVTNPTYTPSIDAAAGAPLDHPWLAPGAPPLLLAAGRLAPAKDFPTLLRAFARLRSTRPAHLVILGEGKRRAGIERLIRELGIEAAVELPGFVDNPFAWMSRAAAFVLSSAWEGSPGVLVEALACGCPIVSTDCPSGPAEILADGVFGRLVPVGDDEALAQAILETLDAPADREALRLRARDFDVERAVERYLDVLRSGV